MSEQIHDLSEGVLTPSEVAAVLRVNRETVVRLLRAGDLVGFRVASAWRIRAVDLQAYVEGNSNRLSVAGG